MNSNEINAILKNDRYTKHVFQGVYATDQIPDVKSFPCSFVINSQPHYEQGLHWLVMHFPNKDSSVEFFDSFGKSPDYYGHYFLDYMHENNLNYKSSIVSLQDNSSRVCGYYCVFYIYYRSRGFEMNEIVNMFTRDRHFNDWSVAQFVDKHFSTV